MTQPTFSFIDQVLISFDQALRTLSGQGVSQRPNPAADLPEPELHDDERKHSAGLMRVNHAGEICAQALYHGQALTARSSHVKKTLQQAAEEESDHLAWCQQRLTELNSHVSYLSPVWYLGSFTMGIFAGAAGDKWSLGFVAETERQVEKHLQKHLNQLPSADVKSRQLLDQMCMDEAQHATTAVAIGAAELPEFIKKWMAATSKVMTTVAYWF
jgi:ubiquinone biosynthesis monooxygenase Coq7